MSAPAARLAELAALWRLEALVPVAQTPRSWVYRGTQDGEAVALKLLTAAGAEEIVGAALLRWWDGAGAVGLRAAADDAMLLDWCDGGTLGARVRAAGDGDSVAGLVGLIRRLQAPRAAPVPVLAPLARRMAPLLACREGPRGTAAALARELLATTEREVPLHGDLHHDNVMLADDAPAWVAIDPKGVLGDPAYEAANLFLNPGTVALERDPAALAEALAAGCGWPLARVTGWAAAHCALAGVWSAADGEAWDVAEAMLLRLLACHAAVRQAGGSLTS
ncbi:streptomycin phosphotransferase, streptomycin-resistance [Oceanicola granulosus HTCC2516]|uniref:Streptomycin phosphotransferase, streptomycin-resistance n=1 Tax=Oceanicola granulosus (strain ATCC BAA-861 / DSM 15982 / KCTC 12143 / HTCC2516) TaxID=314256 RepID=Q2CEH5_OCEGH|nr:aminoglycoside phosphotransferase family protein [Oceanicola granulosus]EAR51022.1 streptomycin phosphotransferase, streptomycin-resistance [Oceanicola granulosus HTCC2516]